MKIIIKTIVMIIMIIINWSNMMTIIITANPDDIPVTHTYLQDSGEESDTASTLEVKNTGDALETFFLQTIVCHESLSHPG